MRRPLQLNRAWRVLATSLALVGMWGQALASTTCAASLCSAECPGEARAVKLDGRPCHAAKAGPSASHADHEAAPTADRSNSGSGDDCQGSGCKGSCCCEVRTAPHATPVAAGFALPSTPLLIGMTPISLVVPAFSLIERAQTILFHSDGSPPSVAWLPDFGRAPPVA